MKLAHSLFSLIVLSSALAAQSVSQPKLVVELPATVVKLYVISAKEPFLGAAIVSLSPSLMRYAPALPPLLTDFVLVGMGFSGPGGAYACSFDENLLPPGMMAYAQGVTFDGSVWRATPVGACVLNDTVRK
jgi:hypothetical protein